ncbi:gamma-glutamylcyclotransferase family protein [Tuwongella immobilis]|uniref:Gamma-glutamylcyclotransferase family protein n=1 Tax=Tuwongella immobilis TaxID=692036 RepID=A0A6C2YQ15_9BACT|nr:gamma-glutamylcyclotransferase family protein [Tuwongella immobilis]VIP03213.1 Gamma-glutamyl cyclotransferase OS=Opitutaceae bacterium TAV5 GN=OPIT5_28875 PE=4 SV=1: AIG2 [Tuwongella immobilis]VTS03727.1 Gamma-glutamyl cyclotransferase OS=Opitutaceae bacterium TAV5 GN=OPIT5_28875 PE=4 SV=1: AIG2 [Tuwongella immobilis]
MSRVGLFLYGTLKRGQRRHDLLASGEFLGPAVTIPRYRLYALARYPILVESPENGDAIHGELWVVPPETLDALDAYEEVPTLYVRQSIALQSPHPMDLPIEAYLFAQPIPANAIRCVEWPIVGSA